MKLYQLKESLFENLSRTFCWLRIKIKEHPGGSMSLALHTIIIILILGGLPFFFTEEPKHIKAVSVNLTAVPVKKTPVKHIKKTHKKSPVKKIYSKPKKPVIQKQAIAKPIKKVTTKPTKPNVRKVVKPKKQKTEPIHDDFESVLKSIAELKKKKTTKNVVKTKSVNIPLSSREVNAIVSQISQNWIIPAGAMNSEDISVTLRISLAMDGSVTNVIIIDQHRYNDSSQTFFRAAADSAARAAYKASPITNLPLKKYEKWKEIELRFDPKELF